MPITLNINQIKQYLPHRYPFLLIDAVEDVVVGESIKARKCVTGNEPFFAGHFPGNPVVPGVLQIEAMGQAGAMLGLLSGAKLDKDSSIYVVKITDARFRRPVVPGDVMSLTATVSKHRRGMWIFNCTTHVGEELASSAVITATTGPKIKHAPLPDTIAAPPEL